MLDGFNLANGRKYFSLILFFIVLLYDTPTGAHSHKSFWIYGSRNVEHGTLFKSDFNIIGMKNVPAFPVRERHSRNEERGTYHVPSDYANT